MWAAIYGVAQSWTRLKQLSSSSSDYKEVSPHTCWNGYHQKYLQRELPWWLSGKESVCQCRIHVFDPWSRKVPHAMEQTKPSNHNYSRVREPQPLNPCALEVMLCNNRSQLSEKSTYHNQRVASTRHNQRKAGTATETQHSQ